VDVVRAEGKLSTSSEDAEHNLKGTFGMGHKRCGTHGKRENNAHPTETARPGRGHSQRIIENSSR